MTYFLFLITGLVAGLNNALWGAIKDAPFEGFSWKKMAGTTGVAVGIIFALSYLLPAAPIPVLFGLTYLLSVFGREYWKIFFRNEDQKKYAIPMALAIKGNVVKRQSLRLLGAALYLAFLSLVTFGLVRIGYVGSSVSWWIYILAGTIGGWVSAFGGAWKDAPVEGFQPLKFLRSPLVSLLWSLLLFRFFHSYLEVAYVSLGFTIMTIEFYKSEVSGNTPGKFEGKPVRFPKERMKKQTLLPLYVVTWIYVFGLILYC